MMPDMTPEAVIKTIRGYKDIDAKDKKPLTQEELDALVSIFTSISEAKKK